MKKKLSNILGMIAVVAVFAGCVEYSDGGPGLWNIICLAVALAAGLGSRKLQEAAK